MSRLFVVVGCAVLLTPGILPEAVWAQSRAGAQPVLRSAASASGLIKGTVIDASGATLAGATVSLFGPTMAFAITDGRGRFVFEALPTGSYLVRAHLDGFAAPRGQRVEVAPGTPASFSIALSAAPSKVEGVGTSGVAPGRPVLAAGLVSQPETETVAEVAPVESSSDSHDHSETAWRLRHAKRSVLKDSSGQIALPESGELPSEFETAEEFAADGQGRWAASLVNMLPFSGQVNFLTTSSFDNPQDLFGPGEVPRGIAFISIGAPAGRDADWLVQGAMTEGDVASWVLEGSYAKRPAGGAHAYQVGMSYSTQRYEGGNAAALAAVTDGGRNVGAVSAYDDWTINDHLQLSYGARYSWYDYVNGKGLMSPRAALTISATPRTRLRAIVSQRRVAPGAEEFLPPVVPGLWLPPERTFAPLHAGTQFRAARVRHMEFAIEHDFGQDYVVTVRRFQQNVDDQLVTLFGVRMPAAARSDLGHYFVGNAGNVDAIGWGVTLSRDIADRLHASVDYSRTRARWAVGRDAVLLASLAPSAIRPTYEDLHDVSTTVETEIPETATRVFVVYQVNTGFTSNHLETAEPGVDARFDVQVRQALPFMRFVTSTQWEVLVAVRNMFREPASEASVYDELLVARPPKRIVGGLLVRF